MSSAEWMLENDYKWMNPDQRHCYAMLCDWVGGDHHLPKVKEWGVGICVNWFQDLSTFDWNRLTVLVFLAHDRCVRVEIGSSGPGRVRIMLHRRHQTEGDLVRRHPTLDAAIAVHRKAFPLPAPAAQPPERVCRCIGTRRYTDCICDACGGKIKEVRT